MEQKRRRRSKGVGECEEEHVRRSRTLQYNICNLNYCGHIRFQTVATAIKLLAQLSYLLYSILSTLLLFSFFKQ